MTIRLVRPTDRFESLAGGPVATGQVNRNNDRYAAIVRAGKLVLWRADLAARMMAVAGWEVLTGRPETDALGRGYLDAIHPDDRHLLDFRNRGGDGETDMVEAQCRVLDRDGRWRWVRGRGVLIPAARGFPAEWVGTLEDIHDQRRALDRASYLADHDALTGLGNRRTLSAYLTRLRDRGASATLVMLDVGKFKAINDLHGHQAGDRFLVRLGQIMVAAAPPHSLCARLGGDEFCIVTPDTTDALTLADKLQQTLRNGVSIGSLQLQVTVRAGIAEADWTEPDPVSRVLRKADLAMRRAKESGQSVVVHNPQMQAESDHRDQLLRAMRSACQHDEFFIEYQPIVELPSRATVSYEALVRWQHPEFGRIEPTLFVRLAERNGMIAELGRWIMDRVCADLARTPPQMGVNLNVSVRELAEPGFLTETLDIVRAHGVDPTRITLELTESDTLSMLDGTDVLARLRDAGFRIVLDDFGTEYAVLSHVSSGQFHGIKLSRDFMLECHRSERARIVMRHMVRLCDELGLHVVAEGIETPDQQDTLSRLGIRLMQGYLFGRPRHLDCWCGGQARAI